MTTSRTEYMRAWKAKNPDYWKRYKQKSKDSLVELKAAPCVDCGGTFPPECMDFDHLSGTSKVMDVSTMAKQGLARQRILDEIAKCELVCANCHRIRTKQRLNEGNHGY